MIKTIFNTLKEFFIDLKNVIIKEDFFGSAAEMSYMLTLGIFPFLLSFMVIFSMIGNTAFVSQALIALSQFAPAEVLEVIQTVLREVTVLKGGSLVAIIGFLTTLYLASNTISVIIKCLNKSNKIQETRGFFYKKFLALLMVFVHVVFLFISVNLIIFGQIILNVISKYIYFIPMEVSQLILILRWPVTFILIFLLAMMNYYILPAKKAKIRSVIPGSIFFTIFWLLGSWFFSIYINNFGSYNKVYGSIAAFAILMIWLYFTSVIILIGGEVNNYTFDKINKKN